MYPTSPESFYTYLGYFSHILPELGKIFLCVYFDQHGGWILKLRAIISHPKSVKISQYHWKFSQNRENMGKTVEVRDPTSVSHEYY